MKLPTQAYKGSRDFYPEDKRIQKYMFSVMREACERFGYEEYDAPILEPTDLYLVKGNEEIINEQTYTFKDRSNRSVTIRTEMTPTVSRMVAARRQELVYPVRWYSIPNLWRYERPQRGRLREFWQLNVDIFGVAGLEAEHEVIQLADELMKCYGATEDMYAIKLNSRKLMNYIFQKYVALTQDQAGKTAKLIDRMQKIPQEEFSKLLEELLGEQKAGKLLDILHVKSLDDLPEEVREQLAWKDLNQLCNLLRENGITNAEFDITIMRGFDYYTDIVFEVFDKNPENNRSMFGGGRYDGLVSQFGVEPVPTVGFGMGDVTLQNFLETHKLLPKFHTETDAYVVLIGDVYEKAARAISALRAGGLNVAVDLSGRKADRQIKSAVKKGVPLAIFIGENELSAGKFVVRNLETGVESTANIEEAIKIVKDSHCQ